MGTRSSTAGKENARCLTRDKPKAIDRPLQYSAQEFVSLLKVCKIIPVYKVFDYWCRVKKVKRDIKSVRLGIVLNRTIIIIIIKF